MSSKNKLGKIKIVSSKKSTSKQTDINKPIINKPITNSINAEKEVQKGSSVNKNYKQDIVKDSNFKVFEEKNKIKVKDDDEYMEGGDFSDDIIEQADFKSADEKEDGDVEDPDRELNEDINDEINADEKDIAESQSENEESEENEENEEEDEEDKLDQDEGYGDEEDENKGEN